MTDEQWSELESLKAPIWAIGTKEYTEFDYWICLYTRKETTDNGITLYKLLELYNNGDGWMCAIYVKNDADSSKMKLGKTSGKSASLVSYRKDYSSPEIFREVIKTAFTRPYLRWRSAIKGEFNVQ